MTEHATQYPTPRFDKLVANGRAGDRGSIFNHETYRPFAPLTDLIDTPIEKWPKMVVHGAR